MRSRLYHPNYSTVDKPLLDRRARIKVAPMTTNESICERLREIRMARGFTLGDVERKSHQAIRAVVLGSYERGDRALSVKKAISLANFYGVPLSFLLEEPRKTAREPLGVVLDLRQVKQLIHNQELVSSHTYEIRTICTFISGLVQQRNDYNGEILSIRGTDITCLALALGKNVVDLIDTLKELRLVINTQ